MESAIPEHEFGALTQGRGHSLGMHVIHTVWPYLAVMLLVAGLFPAMERRFNWRIFSVPPIVLTYLFVTALAVSGLWQVNDQIRTAQVILTSHLVPALLFLLLINCDLRAIWRPGPRVLGVFARTSISLFIALISTFLLYHRRMPGDAWHPLAALPGPMAVSLFRLTSPVQYMTSAAFIAWACGVDLTTTQLLADAMLAVVISLGSVGLSGQVTFIATNPPVAEAMGLPLTPLGVMLAVDTVPDALVTLGNVTADLIAASVVTRRSRGNTA